MRSAASGAPAAAWAEDLPPLPPHAAAAAALRSLMAMAVAEFHRARHEPLAIATRTAQPLLWVLVFGAALSGVRGLHASGIPYQTFVIPGVLGQSILTVSLYSGLAIIWERDLGLTQRILVAPGPRAAVILGKALGAAVRAMVQVVLVLAILGLAGMELRWSLLALLGVAVVGVAGAMLFACMSMVIASAVRSREQFMGLGQLIILPLFFASNALYSLELMPGWLRAVATVNPLTYLVEALRRLLVGMGPDRVGVDLLWLVAGIAILAAVATRTYPRKAV